MQQQQPLTFNQYPFLKELGLAEDNLGCYRDGKWVGNGPTHVAICPHNNLPLARVKLASEKDLEDTLRCMEAEKMKWQNTPGPVRGEIVRQIGVKMREKKEALGKLISLEMGKIYMEGLGEVQEYIDICDMATGMSRTIDGKVLPSERPGHFMMEVWNPLGIIGVITAFNFPVAVSGWNATIALICGDSMLWKGALSTSLVTIAVTKMVTEVLETHGFKSVFTLAQGGGSTIGNKIVQDPRVHLVSFTGSTPIGQQISADVHRRFARTILELGGNNAAIIMDDADMELAFKACVFAAVGTAGQRCTTLRRIFIHENHYEKFVNALVKAYKSVKIGNPLDKNNLMGPLHTPAAVKEYTEGLAEIKKQGGKVLAGGNVINNGTGGNYVEPTIVSIPHDKPIVRTELFVPIVYVMPFKNVEEAIKFNNEVPQGLSSCMFTKNL